ncbi:MAG: TlpA disulfide reductase family protein [Ignavibacteriales bacterium]|nr:TlpA disulfide reductase family protein [Ignavibacteriales bacterium]
MQQTSSFFSRFRSRRQALAAGCIVLLLGVPLSLPVLFREQAHPPLLSVGASIPFGTVTTLSGDSVRSGIFSEQKTVLLFFSTSCPHCVRELENLRRLEPEFTDLLFMAAISLEEREALLDLVMNKETIGGLFFDPQRTYARLCGVTAVPAIFFIEKGGRVCYRRIGEAPIAADRQLMKEFLAGGGLRVAKVSR